MTDLHIASLQHLSPWTESITDILGVHLHRYLMPLLLDHKIGHLWVMIGFEASHMPSVLLRITANGSQLDSMDVEYASLVNEVRGQPNISQPLVKPIDDKALTFFPILSISEPGREHIHAFAISQDARVFDAEIFTVALRTRINEAIRAFRHNSLRIIFDEGEGLGIKAFLERVLEVLPVWCGCDHSACLFLSSSLESMVMSGVGPAHFQIMTERLYCAPTEGIDFDNLSSLEFVVNHNDSSGLIGYAFEEARRTRCVGLNIFIGDGESEEWFSMGELQKNAHRVATNAYRPKEKLTVLLPLLCVNEAGDSELFGFLSINFFETMPLASLTSRVLETLATRLGTYLRRSPFFSISAQQLWLLECVREEQLSLLRLCRQAGETSAMGSGLLESFIRNVNKLVAEAMRVPCFAVGYRTTDAQGEEILRFTGARGITRFGDIDLPIYSENVSHSSISALAVRLNRPMTLICGSDRDGTAVFDSEIYVNEARGLLCDARMSRPSGEGWRRLSDYYKPCREGSWATICYPIRLKDEVAGVMTVEVDCDTNWIGWTGFGSYLFYRLLANELAADFSLLGYDVEGGES
ncbi:MAG: hypothetical protein FWC40_04100 [Proteobacteria bacterium]|nr:hypothetical protein [Pseudomonadota bacterium]